VSREVAKKDLFGRFGCSKLWQESIL